MIDRNEKEILFRNYIITRNILYSVLLLPVNFINAEISGSKLCVPDANTITTYGLELEFSFFLFNSHNKFS